MAFHTRLILVKVTPETLKIKQPQIENSNAIQNVTSKSNDLLYRASLRYLRENEINLQTASRSDGALHVVYAQSQYSNPALSAGRTIAILNDIAPNNITSLQVSEINGGLGMFTASIDRENYNRYKSFNVTSL